MYDISQTNARDRLQQAQPEITDAQLIRAVVNNPPVAIVAAEPDQMPEDKGALFEPEEGCIYVRKGMSAQEIFRSVTPELALAGFGDGGKNYCASYLLCKKYGVDTQGFDFTHAPEFFEGMEPQEVRGELAKARDAANNISSRMAKVLEPNRNQSQRQQPQAQHNREDAR